MNSYSRVLTFVLCLGIAHVCSAQDVFMLGTNTLHVSFGVSAVAPSNRTEICTDLARVFSFATEVTNAFVATEQPSVLRPRQMDLPGPVPPPIRSGALLSVSNQTLTVALDETLVTTYLSAIEFCRTNATMRTSADAVIESLVTGSATNLATEAKRALFWLPSGKEGKYSDDMVNQAISQLVALRCHKPSALNFAPGTLMSDGTTPQAEVSFVVTDPSTGEVFNIYGIVFVNGVAKLYVF